MTQSNTNNLITGKHFGRVFGTVNGAYISGSTIEAEGDDWVVVRTESGEPVLGKFDDMNHKKKFFEEVSYSNRLENDEC